MKLKVHFPVITLLILSIISSTMQAQNNDRWRAGSLKELSGDVLFLVCFVSTPNDSWKESEKDEILVKLNESENWLKEQANQYDVNIDFKHSLLNNGDDILFDTIEAGMGIGNERVDWVYRVLKRIGYKNSKQAYRIIKRKHKTDNIAVVIMAKAGGTSYSMRYRKGYDKKKYFIEGTIIFDSYSNEAPMPIPAVIAHETLHLAGAWDLYTTYAQTADRQQKAHELYPDDIMLRVDHSLTNINIDKLTAWLIGWNKNQEDIFEWFRPSDYR